MLTDGQMSEIVTRRRVDYESWRSVAEMPLSKSCLAEIERLGALYEKISEVLTTDKGLLAAAAVTRAAAIIDGGDNQDQRAMENFSELLAAKKLADAARLARANIDELLLSEDLSPAEALAEALKSDIDQILGVTRRSYSESGGYPPSYRAIAMAFEQITGEQKTDSAIHNLLNKAARKRRVTH